MADTLERMRVTGSRVAGTAVDSARAARRFANQSFNKAMENSKTGWNMRAIGVAMFAVSMIPVIGMGISYGLERHRNGKIASNQKEVFANHFRKQIGAQLRIDPAKVNASHLALIDPKSTLGKAASKIKRDKNDANRSAALSNGAAAAASVLVPIPGAGTITHAVAKMGVDTASRVAGGAVATAFNKDVLHTSDVIGMLDEKKAEGKDITAADIVTLRISQDEELQKALKKQNGIPFHKMNEAGQRAVLIGMPDMADAQALADDVNADRVEVQDVLMMKSTKPSWSKKIAQERAVRPTGSFVDQYNARAANAQMATAER